jgi:thioredoxin-like negative regulator of GroEL
MRPARRRQCSTPWRTTRATRPPCRAAGAAEAHGCRRRRDPAALAARIDANPDDLAARLQLAHALALAQDHRAAMEQLLEIVRRDRKWQDEAARKTMLDLFALLGTNPQFDDLVREFRIRLSRTLN